MGTALQALLSEAAEAGPDAWRRDVEHRFKRLRLKKTKKFKDYELQVFGPGPDTLGVFVAVDSDQNAVAIFEAFDAAIYAVSDEGFGDRMTGIALTHPDHRRRGLAAALVRLAEAETGRTFASDAEISGGANRSTASGEQLARSLRRSKPQGY